MIPRDHHDKIYHGDCRDVMPHIASDSVALAIWSPPYFVGKDYEKDESYHDWTNLLDGAIGEQARLIKEGGFMAVNINDILAFSDPDMPRIAAENPSLRRCKVTENDVKTVKSEHPDWNRYQIARALNCSEQTVQRRTHGVNVRGGKYLAQTRVHLSGNLLVDAAKRAGLFLYDRRVWVKDAAWENCQWHSNSYRSVDDHEYVYIFWKPGPTLVNRTKLSPAEWGEWGSRGIWSIRSVRANDDHTAKFPVELPLRLIRLLSEVGDTVLDPFVGSGTTALAARSVCRHFIGIERSDDYYALACRAVCQSDKEGTLWNHETTSQTR